MREFHPHVRPNTVHFSSLISACATAGRWEEAMRVPAQHCFILLARKPLKCPLLPPVLACVRMCNRHRRLLRMQTPIVSTRPAAVEMRQSRWMQGAGYALRDRVVSPNGTMQVPLAQVFAHMQAAAASDAACAPNVITYSALMTACCAGGRPDKAYEVFQVLVPYTIQPKSIHRLHVLLA